MPVLPEYDPNILQRRLAQELQIAGQQQALQDRAIGLQLEQQLAPLRMQEQALQVQQLQQALDPAFQERQFAQKLNQALQLEQIRNQARGPQFERIDNELFRVDPITGALTSAAKAQPKPVNPIDALKQKQIENQLKQFELEQTPEFQKAKLEAELNKARELAKINAEFRPVPGQKSAKLSEDERKSLLAGISQSKIIPTMVQDYKELAKKGLAGPVAGKIQGTRTYLGVGNKEFTEAESKSKGNLFKLARALQGAGILTEPDIKRMEDIAPPLDVSEDQYIGGMKGVATMMKDNLSSFVELNSSRLDPESFKAANNAISQLNSFIAGFQNVQAPDGKIRRIPSNLVDQAIAAGGKVIP